MDQHPLLCEAELYEGNIESLVMWEDTFIYRFGLGTFLRRGVRNLTILLFILICSPYLLCGSPIIDNFSQCKTD